MHNERIFCGIRPTGILWADRKRLVGSDYATLAFLPFDTLELKLEADCPKALIADIRSDAAVVQAKRGTFYRVSSTGKTVMLGGKVKADV